jgi:hypothetical protein
MLQSKIDGTVQQPDILQTNKCLWTDRRATLRIRSHAILKCDFEINMVVSVDHRTMDFLGSTSRPGMPSSATEQTRDGRAHCTTGINEFAKSDDW